LFSKDCPDCLHHDAKQFLDISPDGDCFQGLPKNALAEKNRLDWLAPVQLEFFNLSAMISGDSENA
jgi:hypothetical protein